MNQEATQKNKDVQTGSEVVEALLKGEIERLKEDLDRLHRERDAFQRQCSVMAEEMTDWEAESKRLDWMVKNHGRVEFEFGGNCYVTFILKNQFKATLGSDDTRVEIDRAMEMCK
jgi:predicted RNase H-like nuclease (RuvC/YqgF family)